MNKIDNITKLIPQVYGNMLNALKDEEDKDFFDKIELNDDNLTDFFTANLLSLKSLFEKITGDDKDLIDFIGILNKLAVQFLLAKESKPKKNNKENK